MNMGNIRRNQGGFSLIELLVTMSMSLIVALAVGSLLVGGQRSWNKMYRSGNSQIKQDAQALMITFGSVGRKSNRLDYTIYKESSGNYTKSTPLTSNTLEVVYGDAVEFRYWDASSPEASLLDVDNTGTHYAFFYIADGNMLKVDYGENPPGAIPGGSGSRNTSNITTEILARNVHPDSDGAFNHTTINRVGQGCIRINVTLVDADDPNETIRVLTSTLPRNIWPR